ncbi:hypothetical protein [Gaetbulibacter sp. PBL-D1]|uniref:hypothetical protein n=1 Tax=Gaetbulibacter sp. PBL-D1 TaxID=3422594 RepID=UPI003D2F3482
MGIKLGAHGQKPEYNTDEYLKKFIPLVIKHASEFDNFSLRDLTDKMKLSDKDKLVYNDNDFIYDLKTKLKEIGLANVLPNGSLSLTDKGRDKKNGTEPHNRLTKYQKIYLPLFIVFGLSTFCLGWSNYLSNKEVNFQKEKNSRLESDFAHYKDSVNEYIKTIKSKTKLNVNDSLQTRN